MPTAKAELVTAALGRDEGATVGGEAHLGTVGRGQGPLRTVDWHLPTVSRRERGSVGHAGPGGPNRHIAKGPVCALRTGPLAALVSVRFANHRRMRSLLAIGPRHAGSFAPI